MITLKKHQWITVNYLLNRCSNQKSILLFHFMGTGKTITTLKYLSYFIKRKKIIIVCPENIKQTWFIEIEKMKIPKSLFTLMNYNEFVNPLNKIKTDNVYLILDECHNICPLLRSNIEEKKVNYIYEYIKSFEKKILLSGTPIYEYPYDVSHIFNILTETTDYPCDEKGFIEKYGSLNFFKSISFWTIRLYSNPLFTLIVVIFLIYLLVNNIYIITYMVDPLYNPRKRDNYYNYYKNVKTLKDLEKKSFNFINLISTDPNVLRETIKKIIQKNNMKITGAKLNNLVKFLFSRNENNMGYRIIETVVLSLKNFFLTNWLIKFFKYIDTLLFFNAIKKYQYYYKNQEKFKKDYSYEIMKINKILPEYTKEKSYKNETSDTDMEILFLSLLECFQDTVLMTTLINSDQLQNSFDKINYFFPRSTKYILYIILGSIIFNFFLSGIPNLKNTLTFNIENRNKFYLTSYKKLTNKISRYISYSPVPKDIKNLFPTVQYKTVSHAYNNLQINLFVKFTDSTLSDRDLHLLNFTENIQNVNLYKEKAQKKEALNILGLKIGNITNKLENTFQWKKIKNEFEGYSSNDNIGLNSKFKFILSRIISNKSGKIGIYSNFTKIGSQLISVFLNQNKIKHFYLDIDLSIDKRKKLLDSFNSPKNTVNVIVLTPEFIEGISLMGIKEFHILEPIDILSKYEQVCARCVRMNSHMHLPEKERNLIIFNHVYDLNIKNTLWDFFIIFTKKWFSGNILKLFISEQYHLAYHSQTITPDRLIFNKLFYSLDQTKHLIRAIKKKSIENISDDQLKKFGCKKNKINIK